MSSPPPAKKQKQFASTTSSHTNKEVPAPQAPLAPRPNADLLHPPASPPNPRKRRASHSPKLNTLPPGTALPLEPIPSNAHLPASLADEAGKKRGRTNTPWTAQEEQRLKRMRDAGHSWSEIAKAFPARTEGSVKKHWYKDMHYAEFAEDESAALREAIKEYEANKWKAIGQKLGKPAKVSIWSWSNSDPSSI
ncbi:Myb-like DNA-binding domain-containing protein isoform 1 [Cladophialophora immunda]|nr:Myb-like DNA-binding domain-containing protein isoform 1 [Cladophialophora immunda]